MAAAIPIVVAFASAGTAVAAAGGIAAAVGTVTGFLSIAGAALTAVGAITKNTKLTKIGGFMGLAGGVGTALGLGAAGAASGSAAQEAANAAWSSGGAAEVAGGAGASSLGSEVAGAALPEGLQVATQEAANQAGSNLALANTSMDAVSQAEPGLYQKLLGTKATETIGPSTYDFGTQNPLQARATGAGLTSADVQSGANTLAQKAGSAISQVGQFARDNKELINLGGSALASMYGPDAEKMQLLKDQDAFNQSIYRRRMANMNSPVRLSTGGT